MGHDVSASYWYVYVCVGKTVSPPRDTGESSRPSAACSRSSRCSSSSWSTGSGHKTAENARSPVVQFVHPATKSTRLRHARIARAPSTVSFAGQMQTLAPAVAPSCARRLHAREPDAAPSLPPRHLSHRRRRLLRRHRHHHPRHRHLPQRRLRCRRDCSHLTAHLRSARLLSVADRHHRLPLHHRCLPLSRLIRPAVPSTAALIGRSLSQTARSARTRGLHSAPGVGAFVVCHSILTVLALGPSIL